MLKLSQSMLKLLQYLIDTTLHLYNVIWRHIIRKAMCHPKIPIIINSPGEEERRGVREPSPGPRARLLVPPRGRRHRRRLRLPLQGHHRDSRRQRLAARL